MGWFILITFILGAGIFGWSCADDGHMSADDHMAQAFFGLIGIALLVISVLTLLGVGLWNLF